MKSILPKKQAAEALIARSIPILGTAARLLAPEDNLLQVALHTAKHSYVRAPGFRLHTDVDRIVRRQTIDWDLFLARTLALQVKTPVYFSLAIPNALFGTPIPDRVLPALRPPRWKERLLTRWLNRAGLFNPDECKFSRPGYILFTALLYDDLSGLWRAVFPERGWMQARYGFRRHWLLPYYHGRRLIDLAFRRVST
ncbi:MAG: nucleotidyltransferase family protein [Chloroflexota bacterium]|nr:nucleotidyltransferase family protein [Chloroflexota bacterium]